MEMLLRRTKGLLIQLNLFHEPQILKLHFGCKCFFILWGLYDKNCPVTLENILIFYFVFSGRFFNKKDNLIPLCFMTRRDSTEVLIPMAQLCHHATTKFTEHGQYVKIHPKIMKLLSIPKTIKKSSHGKSSKFSEL